MKERYTSTKLQRVSANQELMGNITDFGEEMYHNSGRKVVHLLLRTELILTIKMKAVQEHPDAAFTIMLKQLKAKIREQINVIMDDELGYLNAGDEGPSSHALFLYRTNFIEPNAAQLLLFAQSFRFDIAWCSECFHRLAQLAIRYKEAHGPS